MEKRTKVCVAKIPHGMFKLIAHSFCQIALKSVEVHKGLQLKTNDKLH